MDSLRNKENILKYKVHLNKTTGSHDNEGIFSFLSWLFILYQKNSKHPLQKLEHRNKQNNDITSKMDR